MRDLNNVDLKGKKVILRADLNVPIYRNKITDLSRAIKLKPTIDFLKSKGARIILLSHLGRPNGIFDTELSLAHLVWDLEELYQSQIIYSSDIISPSNIETVSQLEEGEIFLPENLRFDDREEANNREFARELAEYGEIYVNDAFSCCHRAHASICAITEFLPAYPGLQLKRELDSLSMMLNATNKPVVIIVAGKKVSTKFAMLENLVKIADQLIIAGAMANTFLKAFGYEVGASLYEEELIPQVKEFIAKHNDKIVLPLDAMVAEKIDGDFVNMSVANVNSIHKNQIILDIGPQSVGKLVESVLAARTLLWNGPLGFYEDSRFAISTLYLARVIAKRTIFGHLNSVIGGGDTVAAVEPSGLLDKFSYVSTAGGALMEWLEGKELPGISCLKVKD